MPMGRGLILAFGAILAFCPALVRAQGTPEATGAAQAVLVRGDAGQTGRMPGPGPAGPPTLLWYVPALTSRGFAPVVAGNVVVAMADQPEAAVVGLDAATGAELWRLARGRRLTLPGAPTVADGVVYAGARETEGERRPILVALDAATSQERWRVRLAGTQPLDEWDVPLAVDGTVYVAATDSNAYAFDAATGAERWRVPIGPAMPNPPALADGLLVFPLLEGLVALDAATGAERWRGGPERLMSSVVIDAGSVYVVSIGASQFEGGILYALDAATGATRWTSKGGAGTGVVGDPVVAGGVVFVDGLLDFSALDAATGAVRWQLADVPDLGTPAIAGDIVYVPHGPGFDALDQATGDVVWSTPRWDTAGDVLVAHSGPAIVDGRIFVYAGDGLAALGADATATPVA
jgi:outer membrane protein assembly factor BamB